MVARSDKESTWPISGVEVMDSNSCIELKRRVRILQQWRFFAELTNLVCRGSLVFPWEVRQELVNVAHPDVPGAWSPFAFELIPVGLADVDDRHTDAIRERYYPNLGQAVDDVENADPYVVGMALTLRTNGVRNVVVSEDGTIVTACHDLGLDVMNTDEFIEKVNSPMHPEQSRHFE